MCATDGPMEIPAKPSSPILVAICFYVVIFGTPVLSIYLIKEKK
jgi:hypothetical protein